MFPADSTSSNYSTSAINSISADDSAAAVPSTSAARPVHLISPRPSRSLKIPGSSTCPKPLIRIRSGKSRYAPSPYGITYQESVNHNDHRLLHHPGYPTAHQASCSGSYSIKKQKNLEYESHEHVSDETCQELYETSTEVSTVTYTLNHMYS